MSKAKKEEVLQKTAKFTNCKSDNVNSTSEKKFCSNQAIEEFGDDEGNASTIGNTISRKGVSSEQGWRMNDSLPDAATRSAKILSSSHFT